MRNNLKIGLGFFSMCILLLSGCSLFSPVKTENESTYELNTVPHVPTKKSRHPKTILVMQPEATPTYNSSQMIYAVKPYQTNYFAKSTWDTSPAYMLQPLIIQTLQNTHHYRAVVSPSFIGNYEYVLNTQLLELQQDFSYMPSVVHLTLRAQLTRVSTNKVIATKQFSITKRTPENTPYGGVVAANQATGILLQELARFCLKST